jgi:hypothetical protein
MQRPVRVRIVVVAAFTSLALMSSSVALADHATPGEAGSTKVNVYDNTHNGWNVTTNDPATGGADPVIGFVNFRPTVPDDLDHIVIVASVKNAAPDCTLTIELVTVGTDPDSGLPPDGFHTGFINVIGTLTTNQNGNGNSGAIVVDVTTLDSVAPSGDFTWGHIDLEDDSGTCVESDGTGVEFNEYGASAVEEGDRVHWLQP